MKKLFAIAVLGSVMLVSCKKSSSGGGLGEGNVQATINDTTTTFNIAGGTSTNGGKEIDITSANGTGSTATQFEIDIQDTSAAITTGTYHDKSLNNTGFFLTLPSGDYYDNAELVTNPITITVTSISSTQIQGTFQGDIYLNEDSASTKKIITNGKFNVKLTSL
jgi:hypothetical protein